MSMPDRVRATVTAGATNKSVMLSGADNSRMTSPMHAQRALRTGTGAARRSSVPPHRARRESAAAAPRRNSTPLRASHESDASENGGSAFATKVLDDDVDDEGAMHTRNPSVGPAATAPSVAAPASARSSRGATPPGSRGATPPGSPPALAAPAEQSPRVLAADEAPQDETVVAADDVLPGPVWRGIAKVAPNAEHTAALIENQQMALRSNLRDARSAIRNSRYGHIERRGPSAPQRVQQRTAHATYYHMMRQQKAREEDLRRNADWQERFFMR